MGMERTKQPGREGCKRKIQKWVHTALLFGGGGPAKLQELHQTSLINERDGHILHERLLGAGHLYTSSAGTDMHVWINTPNSASGSSRTNSGQRSSIQAPAAWKNASRATPYAVIIATRIRNPPPPHTCFMQQDAYVPPLCHHPSTCMCRARP